LQQDKVTKEAEILQEGFSLIFCRVKLLPDSNNSERKEEIPRNIRRLFFPILPTKGSQLYTFTKNQDNKISYCRL